MSSWMRVTPTGLKPMSTTAVNLNAPIPESTQAKLEALFKSQRDIWLGNQHITTNEDGSVKSVQIDATHQVLDAGSRNTKLTNSAETLQNTSPYNSSAQKTLDKLNSNGPVSSNNLPQSKIRENKPSEIAQLSPQVNQKLDALLNATRLAPDAINPLSNDLSATLGQNLGQNIVEPSLNNDRLPPSQVTLALNDLDVSESQSIALQRTGLGLNLSEKATNDIAQLKAGLIAQTVKQTENVVTQVNARYNPFAAAQQVASQHNWLNNQSTQAAVPDTKILAEAGLMPQAGASDKQNNNSGMSLASNNFNQQNQNNARRKRAIINPVNFSE